MTITTGEYLVSKSSLPSGTAMAHWLSVQSGDRIIYCAQVTAIAETDDIAVTRKPKRAQHVIEQVAVERSISEKKKDIFAKMTSSKNIVVLFEADEITVTKRISQISTVRRAADGS